VNKIQLSVIIPTYNCESSIVNCLQSIIQQDFSTYEIIIKDGGSTDGTLNIINDIKRKHPHVRVVLTSEPDKGIYDAMNKAVGMSAGTWLYFLGSDDYLFNEHVFSRIFSITDVKDVQMIYGNVVRNYSGDTYMGRFDFEKLLNYNICHQSIFLRKSAFLTHGPFDTRYLACADWDLNLKLFKHKIRTKFANIIVANYNEKGYSNAFYDQLFFEALNIERQFYYSKWPNKLASLTKRAVNKLKSVYDAGKMGRTTN